MMADSAVQDLRFIPNRSGRMISKAADDCVWVEMASRARAHNEQLHPPKLHEYGCLIRHTLSLQSNNQRST
ncbi:hypothetical protein F2P81_004219 [Scophthalmus maximus]|uniref:Uncharacterized protein n=1 Tax=Scophthalmus maximus TaxID=52904 RepID=A0A6A4TLK8_SCOMX|nr:hypothetical protein F2P81_004219 [Scophthalmus maximus]